jgi:hypothetical protein
MLPELSIPSLPKLPKLPKLPNVGNVTNVVPKPKLSSVTQNLSKVV